MSDDHAPSVKGNGSGAVTSDHQPPGSDAKDPLAEQVAALREEIETLRGELERERERRRELEERLGPIEYRGGTEDLTGPEHLDELYIENYPLGTYLRNLTSQHEFEGLQERVGELEATLNTQIEDTDPEDVLPIMQLARSYKSDPELLDPNPRRAAKVWINFFDVATRTPTKIVLDSSSVRTILATDREDRPHQNTVRRTMELVAKFGKQYVTLEKIDRKNTLVIDRVPFETYVEELQQSTVVDP